MDLQVFVFLVGAFILVNQIWKALQVIARILVGAKVTPERYGADSWAVVTGSTDGIGKAMAIELALRGFNIVLISRNIEKLSSTALEIQKVRKGCKTRVVSFDFGSSTKVEAYKGIFDKIKDLDVSILVNNVGLSAPGEFSSKSDTEIFNMTAVNVYPIILLTKFFLQPLKDRYLKSKKKSLIINLSSLAALKPLPYNSTYGSTKLFDHFFSQGLYYELKKFNIDVLDVLPSAVDTNLSKIKENFLYSISAKSCAKDTLDKGSSGITFGGTRHEIQGFLYDCTLVQFVPNHLFFLSAERILKRVANYQLGASKKK